MPVVAASPRAKLVSADDDFRHMLFKLLCGKPTGSLKCIILARPVAKNMTRQAECSAFVSYFYLSISSDFCSGRSLPNFQGW